VRVATAEHNVCSERKKYVADARTEAQGLKHRCRCVRCVRCVCCVRCVGLKPARFSLSIADSRCRSAGRNQPIIVSVFRRRKERSATYGRQRAAAAAAAAEAEHHSLMMMTPAAAAG